MVTELHFAQCAYIYSITEKDDILLMTVQNLNVPKI